MNPNCFGKGANNVPHCTCKKVFQDMIYAMKRRVDDLGDPTLRTPMEAK
jgi:hypothetical protein